MPRPADERAAGYVPAAGHHALTSLYDPAFRLTMRERTLRGGLVERVIAGAVPHQLLDLGCGTGTLAVHLAKALPTTQITGLDPDQEVLARARGKAAEAGVELTLTQGFADVLPFPDQSFDRVVSSMVFHHLPPTTKRKALAEAKRVLRPGGRLHLVDWGRPQDPLMRLVFLAVQALDGVENTREHARGLLPKLVGEAGFVPVEVSGRLRTALGTVDYIDATA
jgi:SAM-dependent methyltransferase